MVNINCDCLGYFAVSAICYNALVVFFLFGIKIKYVLVLRGEKITFFLCSEEVSRPPAIVYFGRGVVKY